MTGIRGDDGEASLEACVGKRSRVAAYRRRRRAVIAFAALIQESTVPRSEWPSEVRPQVARAADNVGYELPQIASIKTQSLQQLRRFDLADSI
jgi:hypothetical protein